MTKASNTVLSPDEIVATLRNSNLPTLLVEGRSDMELFHILEDLCFASRIDIMPTNGRDALFEIFRRRGDFQNTPVAFLADSDMLVFSSIPVDLSGVIFTAGYSIENDILSGGKALRMIARKHRPKWETIVVELSRWFAAVAHCYLAGEAVAYSHHPNQLIDFKSAELTPLSKAMLIEPKSICKAARRVLTEPGKYLRGHTLLDALWHFRATSRQLPKCSKDVLLRMDIVSWETNASLERLITSVRTAIPQVGLASP